MPGKGRQFKPGNPGRPKGSKNKWTLLTDGFRKALETKFTDKDGKEQEWSELDLIITAMILKAQKGDVQAAQFIADRVEGKPRQALEVSSDIPAVMRILMDGQEKDEGGEDD